MLLQNLLKIGSVVSFFILEQTREAHEENMIHYMSDMHFPACWCCFSWKIFSKICALIIFWVTPVAPWFRPYKILAPLICYILCRWYNLLLYKLIKYALVVFLIGNPLKPKCAHTKFLTHRCYSPDDVLYFLKIF